MFSAKIAQPQRDLIKKILFGKCNIDANNFKVGELIEFSYKIKKIQIKNRGIITHITNRHNNKIIKVYNKTYGFVCQLNLINPTLKIKVIKKVKTIHKSRIDYIIK